MQEDCKNYKIKLDKINKNIIVEYNPVIYYDNDEKKIKCIYKNIKYSKDNSFIYDYHKYAELNILSNLPFSTDLKIKGQDLSSIKLAQNESHTAQLSIKGMKESTNLYCLSRSFS